MTGGGNSSGDSGDNCTYLYRSKNSTFSLGETKGGVPVIVLILLGGWLALLLIFLFIRKNEFNEMTRGLRSTSSRLAEALSYRESGAAQSELTRTASLKSGFLRWLITSLKCLFYSEETMLQLAGQDAVQYLRFQTFLIAFAALLTLLSVAVILPINFQGEVYGNKTDFSRTSIVNLEPSSNFLYVHTALAFLLFPISILLMKKFSVDLKLKDSGLALSRTLLIRNIPRDFSTEESLRRHFSEAYPGLNITDVSLAYAVTELTQRMEELEDARDARRFGEQHQLETGEPLMMYPKTCSRFSGLCCSCCSEKVDVVQYYTEEIARLEKEVERLREESLASPLGVAFITFDDIESSKTVYDDHKSSYLSCFKSKPKHSSISNSLKPSKWKVSFASTPRDVKWVNLKESPLSHYLALALFYIGIFWIGLFFTTPEQITDTVYRQSSETFDLRKIPTWISKLIPSLMLMIFATLLPSVINWSVRNLHRYIYKSTVSYLVLRNTFWFLWVVVIIFPTFSLSTVWPLISQITKLLIDSDDGRIDVGWECFFSPHTSEFYVAYVMSATLVGTGLELVRLSEAAGYLTCLCLSSSPANIKSVIRKTTQEFRYGENYARMLLMLAMITMYSFNCPLITPFGLLYFILKHGVDKHNLTWVYGPGKINHQVHRLAINLVVFCVVMLQLFQTVVCYVRSWDDVSGRTYFSLALLVVTLVIYPALVFPDCCRKLSPIQYADIVLPDDAYEVTTDKYDPGVFLRAQLVRQRGNIEENDGTQSDDEDNGGSKLKTETD